jgi:hypothetical protein
MSSRLEFFMHSNILEQRAGKLNIKRTRVNIKRTRGFFDTQTQNITYNRNFSISSKGVST